VDPFRYRNEDAEPAFAGLSQAALAVVNDDPSWTLPMPARYVLAQDGTIVYSEFSEDYTCRPDHQEMIPILSKIWEARK
jgi:hypothetical protein